MEIPNKEKEQKELPERKPTRLGHFDYNTVGAYFITICTQDRQSILSRIVGGDVPDCPTSAATDPVGGDVLDAPKHVELLPHGKIADKYINQLNNFYDNIKIDRYVIMPNHIHMMLLVLGDGASRTSPPTTKQHSAVSQFISTFKRFCNKEYGQNIWQRHFYDHVIRDRKDYAARIKYIQENPVRWYYDELYAKE